MNVLVACEESQEVCKAFRARGHEAFSCDIQQCSGGHPEWHIYADCLPILNGWCSFFTQDGAVHSVGKWDLIIAHPPCTDLAVSGARSFAEKQHDFRKQKSCVFFMYFVLANCDRIAVENPIGIMSTVYRKPDQIIQPWQFAISDAENTVKSTCLWLKGLPPLIPTDIVEGREQKCWRMAPGPDRAKLRSKTYPGIARAMADQWGSIVI